MVQACKDGGNVTGSDPQPDPEPVPVPVEITSSFKGQDTSFLPAEIQFITVEGYILQQDEYKATIAGGQSVILRRSQDDTENKTLLFTVPEETPGSHTLQFTLNEQEQSLSFSIEGYQPIKNPESFANDFIDSLTTGLEGLINQVEDPAFKASLSAVIDSLEQKQTALANFSDDEMKLLARILDTYFVSANGATLSTGSEFAVVTNDACVDPLKPILKYALGVGLSLYTMSIAGTIATTGWGLGVGTIVFVAGTAALYISLRNLKAKLITFWNKCIVETVEGDFSELSEDVNFKTSRDVSRAIESASEGFLFESGDARQFYVVSKFEAPGELQDALNKIKEYADYFIDLLPQSWIDAIFHEYTVQAVDNPAQFGIQNISNDNISGSVTAIDDRVSITFSYKEGSSSDTNLPFTFELVDKESSEQKTTIDATLEAFVMPVVYSDSLFVDINTNTGGQLTGENVETFQIVSAPSNGQLSLSDDKSGTFSYTPKPDYYGQDQFSFIGLNEHGESEPAVIHILVQREAPVVYSKTLYIKAKNASDENSYIAWQDTIKGERVELFGIHAAPENGTFTWTDTEAGTFEYEPDKGFSGTDEVEVKAENERGESEIAEVIFKVGTGESGEPPVITHWERKCSSNNYDHLINLYFEDKDGPGVDPRASYSGGANYINYPVFLEKRNNDGNRPYVFASNWDYRADIIEGTIAEGIIQVVIYNKGGNPCRPLGSKTKRGRSLREFRLHLIDSILNLKSNKVEVGTNPVYYE